MKELEFRVPKHSDLTGAEQVIESVCADRGLRVGMKASLASFPGSIHWHFKKPDEKGTLEITFVRKDRRIWAQVQNGRKAEWIDAELPRVRKGIEQKLKVESAGG